MNDFEKINNDLEKQFNKFDKDIENSRIISRGALYKLSLLSTSIIAFSVTLTSLSADKLRVNIEDLKTSWITFLFSIIFTYFSLFLESRIKFCITWRSLQVREFDKKDFAFPDHLKVIFVALYSVIISPRNLIFCIWKKQDDKYKNYVANMNAKTVGLLADMQKIPLFFELLAIVLFIIGIWIFAKSFR